MGAPEPTDGPELERLASAALDGEPDALDAWYRADHPPVFRLCLGLLADAAEAEDVAQDAMLHLHDNLSAWDRARPYAAWRTTVVLNLCRDRTRRLASRRRAEDAAAEHRLPARLPCPEDEACRAEVRSALEEALAGLSPREREAFVLRDLCGAPTAEAAAAMGVGESSVRSLVTLARRRLRERLAERVAVPGEEGVS